MSNDAFIELITKDSLKDEELKQSFREENPSFDNEETLNMEFEKEIRRLYLSIFSHGCDCKCLVCR